MMSKLTNPHFSRLPFSIHSHPNIGTALEMQHTKRRTLEKKNRGKKEWKSHIWLPHGLFTYKFLIASQIPTSKKLLSYSL